MKKILVFLAAAALTACMMKTELTGVPEPVSYTDWDRAIRVDVDMQNMYSTMPRKIEKPIDMYMAMALALKYNYTRRVVSYEQSLIAAGKSPVSKLPQLMDQAGYLNSTGNAAANSELKVAWNLLDMSTVYYQSLDQQYKNTLAVEQSRKVIHNILQETRVLYWKALSAQKLLPVMDSMIEFMTLEVDEINARTKELAQSGQSLSREDLVKKRKYMESVKSLSLLKRDMETAEVKLSALLGFHPSAEFKLVGPEYGNFSLPEMKSNLAQLEWLALTNRPELRIRDLATNAKEIKASFREFSDPGINQYKNDPQYYNRIWAKKAKEIGITVFEEGRNPNQSDMESLRRQRMTNLVLSQVYVAWAGYMSDLEDYQIAHEIANVSEDIAEDTTMIDGSKAEKSQLEAARAIEDEAKAYMAYTALQDSLGNLYAALGLDAIPYYMLSEKPSKIALYLNEEFEKWREGKFLPDNRPYLLDVPAKRPPVNLTDSQRVPDVKVETGERINIVIPREAFGKIELNGKITTKAGLIDDSPLPSWLQYDENTMTFTGLGMPATNGDYHIKVYVSDESGNVGYITFTISVVDVYVPSLNVKGLVPGRKATVLKRCIGPQCTDDYIEETVIGEEVVTEPGR